VNAESLDKARLLRDPKNQIVLLGRGEIKHAVTVQVHRASEGAIAAVKKAGGSVEIVKVAVSERAASRAIKQAKKRPAAKKKAAAAKAAK
jgi:large subunit ribosomal protein L15